MLPISAIGALLIAAFSAVAVLPGVAVARLDLWILSLVVYAVGRRARSAHLLKHEANIERIAAQQWRLVVGAILAAFIYAAPLVNWAIDANDPARLTFCFLLTILLSGGGVTLSCVPSAAIAYVMVCTTGVVTIFMLMGQPALALLSMTFCASVCASALGSSRRFADHFRAIAASREKSRIIELLRQLGASGSNWLWELDAEFRLSSMSQDMIDAIGSKNGSPVGKLARDVLDPFGQSADKSSGMRTLQEHARAGTPFRDLAIPMLGGTRWWSLSAIPLHDEMGRLSGWRGVGSDITETRLTGNDSVGSARRDPLTSLANRLLVRELVEEALIRNLAEGAACVLLLLDLDRFKQVNDTLGHAVGDHLLVQVAERLTEATGGLGRVGRLGGDEFAVVISRDIGAPAIAALAEDLVSVLSAPYWVGEARLIIGASIGVARGPADGADDLALIRSADLALYAAKEAGRGTHRFYEASMLEEAQATRVLESDVRSALADGQLSLAYQPIVDAVDRRLVGREALLRWQHPERGPIPPDQFIPIVEDLGLIGQIGNWVIQQACADAASWPAHLRVAVNVSVAQLTGATLANSVVSALGASGLKPGRLELEVTESIFIGDDPSTLKSLSNLRSLGVRLVLDDFGKGYSSFGYLSRTKFAKIKIDQSFVRSAADGERESEAIVRAILALAQSLGVETTAEGIETEVQAEAMRQMGCTQLQGYHFGRPERLPTFPMKVLVPSKVRRMGGRQG